MCRSTTRRAAPNTVVPGETDTTCRFMQSPIMTVLLEEVDT